ncbi:hypothetical protein LTR46_005873 [Exophiala xenobiotica]|nr:hypothetical protein LTR46_005873 [Exophiala xenobiotica]
MESGYNSPSLESDGPGPAVLEEPAVRAASSGNARSQPDIHMPLPAPIPFLPSFMAQPGQNLPLPFPLQPPNTGLGQPVPNNLYNPNPNLFFPSAPNYPMTAMDPLVPFDPTSDPPFGDRTQAHQPRPHGVIKIKNIPYGLTMAEVQQFICKHVHIEDLIKPHEEGFPIHIIMERSTGKTMDAYVETITQEIAAQAWEHGFGLARMRHPKLGQRHVTVELSDQAELMKDLFPRARCVAWNNEEFGTPHIVQTNDIYTSGFKGFFTAEEMNGVIRHAEYPQRSPFAMRSFQRTFESTISTLYKFPWYATGLYTLQQRDILFKTYTRQLEILIIKVDPGSAGTSREVGLDNKLLMDFLFAGMNCAGFSERQKAIVADASLRVGPGIRISLHARNWPFQTLAANPVMLSDQDIGMWFEVLNMGLAAFAREGHNFIGVQPHLQVIRDNNGGPLFTYSESGAEISRKAFSRMEKKMLRVLMRKGWSVYMGQLGLAPALGLDQNVFGGNDLAPAYSADDDEFKDDGQEDTIDGEAHHQYTDEERLAAYEKVLDDIKREEGAMLLGQIDRFANRSYPHPDAGLAEGMMALDIGTGRTLHRAALNPESRNFQPRGWNPNVAVNPAVGTAPRFMPPQVWNQTGATGTAANTTFGGTGLGNGTISPPQVLSPTRVTSPPLISTGRRNTGTSPVRSLGVAPVFQVPARRQTRGVSITDADDTPVALPDTGETSPTLRRITARLKNTVRTESANVSPQYSDDEAPATMPDTTHSLPPTPARMVHPLPEKPPVVLMPSAGRPSPGHTPNYGMTSNMTFGAGYGSTGNGLAYGYGYQVRPNMGAPLATGFTGMGMGPSLYGSGPPSRRASLGQGMPPSAAGMAAAIGTGSPRRFGSPTRSSSTTPLGGVGMSRMSPIGTGASAGLVQADLPRSGSHVRVHSRLSMTDTIDEEGGDEEVDTSDMGRKYY